jgi:AbiV family abortive infection protein
MPKTRSRGHELTPEALRSYRDAALGNAEALLEEARVLLTAGHHARAYFLAVAAVEEGGKAVQAAMGVGRNLRDPAVRTRLQTQSEDHGSKLALAMTPWMLAVPDLQAQAMDFIRKSVDLLNGRESAMYVDIHPDTLAVSSPTTVVPVDVSRNCVDLAARALGYIRPYLTSASTQTYTQDQDAFFAMRPAVFQRMANTEDFWNFFIDRAKAGDTALDSAAMAYHRDYFSKGRLFAQPTAPGPVGAA